VLSKQLKKEQIRRKRYKPYPMKRFDEARIMHADAAFFCAIVLREHAFCHYLVSPIVSSPTSFTYSCVHLRRPRHFLLGICNFFTENSVQSRGVGTKVTLIVLACECISRILQKGKKKKKDMRLSKNRRDKKILFLNISITLLILKRLLYSKVR